jgi:Tol biopolymer transport system component
LGYRAQVIAQSRLTIVLAVFVGAATSAPAAEATFSGRNGDLSFIVTSYDGASHGPGEFRAVVTGATGSRPRVLFSCSQTDADPCKLQLHEGPVWSPNGRKIAIGLSLGEMAIASADGTDLRALTSAQGSGPVWSPNGRRLAFVASGDVYTLRVDGNGLRRLTTAAQAREVAWSAEGMLAYTTTESFRGSPPKFGRIITMDANGKNRKEISRGTAPSGLDWSPDGRRLMFVRGSQSGLWEVGPRSRRLRSLVSGAHGGRWSPDGRSLIYARGGTIYRARTDGTRRRQMRLDIPSDWGNPILQDWQARPR